MHSAIRHQQQRSPVRLGAALALVLLVLPHLAAAGIVAPDTLRHVVRDGDTLIAICAEYRDRTNHYSLDDLLTDIRRTNAMDSNFLRIGQELLVPVRGTEAAAEVTHRVRDGAEVRGIYLTGPACGVSSVFGRVDAFIAAGGNSVVFDAKDIDGGVSYRSAQPLAGPGGDRSAPLIPSLDDMMRRFDRRGLYTVARLALFLDGELGHRRPDLALQDSTGSPWTERGCVWMDPAQPEVVAYNLSLAGELARAGVDEIQFDYVRYPTNGWGGDGDDDLETVALRRREVIAAFLTAARDTLDAYGVRISADLYGIMAWDRMEDLALTGQHVPTIAGLVDVICPMIYPSHFGPGFEGRKRPGDDPEYFIAEGTRRFLAQAAGQAEVRPWLQAFAYRVTDYDGHYVGVQVTAARAAGGQGWSLWNPACRYTEALAVLPHLAWPDPAGTVLAASPAGQDGSTAAATTAAPGMAPAAFTGVMAPLRDAGIQRP